MRIAHTLLIAVIFEKVKPYIHKYMDSIIRQSTKEFDLLILNDGFEGKIPNNQANNQVINIINKQTPAEIRQLGINYAIENDYEVIIFTDADDYYSQNYVESLIEGLKNSDFVYSSITPVDNNSVTTTNNYFSLPNEINRYQQIVKHNFIGLGCSAIKSEIIRQIKLPLDIIAVDWYLYTIVLLNGYHGKFIDASTVYYRQHPNNIVGGIKQLDSARLFSGINTKEKHYHHIREYCLENSYESVAEEYEAKYKQIIELKLFLQDRNTKEKYINYINANISTLYKGWWSEIISINEFNAI